MSEFRAVFTLMPFSERYARDLALYDYSLRMDGYILSNQISLNVYELHELAWTGKVRVSPKSLAALFSFSSAVVCIPKLVFTTVPTGLDVIPAFRFGGLQTHSWG